MRRSLVLGLVGLFVALCPLSVLAVDREIRIDNCRHYACPGGLAPIEITAVRNADSGHFLADIEIEVKNVSSHPITYLELVLTLPGLKYNDGAADYGFPVRYGTPHQGTSDVRADPPLAPGETAVLTVPAAIWKAFDTYWADHRLTSEATAVIKLELDVLEYREQ